MGVSIITGLIIGSDIQYFYDYPDVIVPGTVDLFEMRNFCRVTSN